MAIVAVDTQDRYLGISGLKLVQANKLNKVIVTVGQELHY